MASGAMGFSIGGMGGQGGEFPCLITPEAGGYRLRQRTEAAVFNDLDLYLMGLLSASQVADQYVFRDSPTRCSKRTSPFHEARSKKWPR